MTGSLAALAVAVLAFVATHAIPANPRLRGPLVQRLGLPAYMALYSLLSLAVIAWLALAYSSAPYIEVWAQQPWMRWVPPLAMAPACLLLVGGLSSPNPFSPGAGAKRYDPARPGLLRLTRHPFLWGLVLWAGAHIMPNGDAASLILFAPLLALTLVSIRLLEKRKRAALGGDWARLAANTNRPTTALIAEMGWKRIVGGLALYILLIGAHPHVIGVSPLP